MNSTPYTSAERWAELDDTDRFLRVRTVQRVGNALGPTETPLVTQRAWSALTEAQKHELLVASEMETMNRVQYARSVSTGEHGLAKGLERKVTA